MNTTPLKMPSTPSINTSEYNQWTKLLGDAKKVTYRCAECTRPIVTIGFCDSCFKHLKIKLDK